MFLDKLCRGFGNRRTVFEGYVPLVEALRPATTPTERQLRRVTRRMLSSLRQGEGAEEIMVLQRFIPMINAFLIAVGLPVDQYRQMLEGVLKAYGFEERMHGQWLDTLYQAYEDRAWYHPARLLQIFPSPIVWIAAQFANLFVLPISAAVIFAGEVAVKQFYDQCGDLHPHEMIRKIFKAIAKQEGLHILLHSYLYALWLRRQTHDYWVVRCMPYLWNIIIGLVWLIGRPLPRVLGVRFAFVDFRQQVMVEVNRIMAEAQIRAAALLEDSDDAILADHTLEEMVA